MKHDFKPYLNPVFIETGSYGGDGIKAALEAEFPQIISIELAEKYYNLCKERYPQSNVRLIFGDSLLVLPELLPTINERCTFWLDGHLCGDDTAKGVKAVPLIEELFAIGKHHIKNHTILIDDIRLLRNHEAEWSDLPYCLCDIKEVIRGINPNYKLSYDFGVVKDDILIAQVL